MTILEQAPYSTALDEPQPITVDVGPAEQIVEPASAPADEQTRPSSRSHRRTVLTRPRQYNHPRRERFVDEAAMSREMFRL
jgi:hypothetical protein